MKKDIHKNLKAKSFSVSVAISAFNEEGNIGNILNSILQQKRNNFSLRKIVVYSDGSTDETCKIVKKMQRYNPIIKLVFGKKQRGKIFRLKQIFRNCDDEILIVLDADIDLVGDNFLNHLTEVIISDPDAKMVVAHQIPLRSKSFIGKIIYASYLMWDYVRLSVPNCDHVQNFYGAATAYRGSFARTLRIPDKLTEERLYIYMMAKKTDGFCYCNSAKIVYWPVSTLAEFLKLAKRSFGNIQPEINKIVGIEDNASYTIPWKYKFQGIAKSLYCQPFYTPFALFFNFFLSRLTLLVPSQNSPLWEVSLSTKKSFNHEKIS